MDKQQHSCDDRHNTILCNELQNAMPTRVEKKRKSTTTTSWKEKVVQFYVTYNFLIKIACSILLARLYPPLGATYLHPEITATWIGVVIIFFLVGLCLKTSEFSTAIQRVSFNAFVQAFNFGVVSGTVYGVSRGLATSGVVSTELANGMVVCASLPTTINMVFILTKAAGGDEAVAVFNGVLGNCIGVFLSPVLILGYIGVTGDVDVLEVFAKLAIRVVLPVTVGQILQKISLDVRDFIKMRKDVCRTIQQLCIFYIIYTVFCRTFDGDSTEKNSMASIFTLIAFQFLSLLSLKASAWFLVKSLFPDQPQLQSMAVYGCVHKSVGMGIPLIGAIYENDPNVGLYTLPLLIWHPMQLCIGSIIAPRLAKYVEREEIRLGTRGPEIAVTASLPEMESTSQQTPSLSTDPNVARAENSDDMSQCTP